MNLIKKLIWKRKMIIIFTVFLSVSSLLVSLSWNEQLSRIINRISEKQLIEANNFFYPSGLIILSTIVVFFLSLCSNMAHELMAHDLRIGYGNHFTSLPLEQIEALSAGEQLSKLQNEMRDASSFLRANLFSMVDDIVKFLGTFTWLLWLNKQLALLSFMPVILIIIYTVYASKVIGKAAEESQETNMIMTGFAETLITTFPIIRLFDVTKLMGNRYNEALNRWELATIKEERRRASLMSLSGVIACIPLLMLFFIGGSQIIQGELSLGIFYIFINLSGNVSGVMMNMPGRIASFRRFSVNMKRLEPYVSVDMGGRKK